MKLDLDKIVISGRAREDLGDIEALAISIEKKQIYPVVVSARKGEDTFDLLDGGRRIAAARLLGWKQIEAITWEETPEHLRKEIEFKTCFERKALTVIEEAKLIRDVHKLKQTIHGEALPGRFSKGGWSIRDTSDTLKISAAKVSEDIRIADGVERYPQLLQEINRRDILRTLKTLEDSRETKLKLDQVLKIMEESYCYVGEGELPPKLEPNCVDLLITDLGGTELNLPALLDISNLLRPTGQAYVFVPLVDTQKLIGLARDARLKVEETPYLLNLKGTDTFQTFLWISKGPETAPFSLRRTYNYSRDEGYLHEMDKPFPLLHFLITSTTKIGDFVYHPNGYSGVSIKACLQTRRNCLVTTNNKALREESLKKMKEEGEKYADGE